MSLLSVSFYDAALYQSSRVYQDEHSSLFSWFVSAVDPFFGLAKHYNSTCSLCSHPSDYWFTFPSPQSSHLFQWSFQFQSAVSVQVDC